MSLLKSISKTGGNPALRRSISETILTLGVGQKIRFDDSVYWFQNLFETMDTWSNAHIGHPLHDMYKELNRFYNGHISEEELLRSSDYHFRKLDDRINTPTSSYTPYTSTSNTPKHEVRHVREWSTKMIVTYAIYTCFFLFFPIYYRSLSSITDDGGVTVRVRIDEQQHGPKENKLLPTIRACSNTNSVDNRVTQTSYIKTNVLTKYSPVEYLKHEDNVGREKDISDRRSKFIEGTTLRVDTPQFSLYASDKTKYLDDVENLNVIEEWIKYTLASIDPAYALSSIQKMNIVISDESGDYAGLYLPHTDDVYVNVSLPDSVVKEGRQLLHTIRTLVHELSHRVHLFSEEILVDCKFDGSDRSKLCIAKAKPHGLYRNLHMVEDEVYATVFLGLNSKNMTYPEAKHYLRLILDMKINEIYEHAVSSGLYKDFMGAYGVSSAREFWAEASSEFLIQDFPHVEKTPMMFAFDRFAPRDWIEKNDPKLFALLKEVYSGSSVFSCNETKD